MHGQTNLKFISTLLPKLTAIERTQQSLRVSKYIIQCKYTFVVLQQISNFFISVGCAVYVQHVGAADELPWTSLSSVFQTGFAGIRRVPRNADESFGTLCSVLF